MHTGFVGRHTAIAVRNLRSNISRLGGAAGSSGEGIYDVRFIMSLCRMLRLILSAKCVVANKHSADAKGDSDEQALG